MPTKKTDAAKVAVITKKIERMEKEMLASIVKAIATLDKRRAALVKAAAKLKAKRA
jgi:hypothetical protein